MPRIRKLGNGSFVLMTNLLFSASFSDLCYGYHAFWRHCLKDLDITDKRGFEIDTALYLQALRKKLCIVEVPSFEGYRFFGVGKLQTIPDGFRVLRTIISEWLASLRPDQEELYIGFRGAAPQSDKLLQLGARSTVLKQVLLELHFMRLFGLLLFQDYPKDKALERVLQYSLEALNAESGSILFLDDEGQVTNALLAYEGIFHPNDSDIVNRIVSDGLAGWVVRNRRPALVYNTHEDPRWIKREWELAERLDGRSALSIPIVLEGRLTGVLTLVRNTPDHFTENDLNLLHQFSFGS